MIIFSVLPIKHQIYMNPTSLRIPLRIAKYQKALSRKRGDLSTMQKK